MNHTLVSIQLLFLFNSTLEQKLEEIPRFNTASVLIQLDMHDKMVKKLKFQYSFCSYSTVSFGREQHCFGRFNTASVLIQHTGLPRWPDLFCSFNTASVLIQLFIFFVLSRNRCFNTASVLIQRIENMTASKDERFQYSFCSYSTSFLK